MKKEIEKGYRVFFQVNLQRLSLCAVERLFAHRTISLDHHLIKTGKELRGGGSVRNNPFRGGG